ncbi:plakophilin-3 isoform X1 [Notothenia coriiceps]|uniref:Plakophilin-3 isoform X1 n=1 Tax=Notothenia coriiceps TaxID=8208 RepID=A0A6I9Q204_9TELE|nr:PREDICTED: plakophilin-3 isoform X1 [Notothenia coriiceps]
MSIVGSESVFLSALKPNTSVTTYGLPSEIHLGNGGTMSDEMTRARRVQQQVQMRLAEKSTLPRQNGSTSHYAMSDYGGASTLKHQTNNPSYSSKSSYMYSGSKTMGPRISQKAGFSARSAGADLATLHKISVGGMGGGGGNGGAVYQSGGYQSGGYQSGGQQSAGYQSGGYQSGGYQSGGYQSGGYQSGGMQTGGMQIGGLQSGGLQSGGYQGGGYQTAVMQTRQVDPETLSMNAVRQHTAQVNPGWVDTSDAYSMVSERDATYGRQYAQSAVNGYATQVRQGGSMTFNSPMHRSLSGTLGRSGEMTGGEVEVTQQHSYKGPAHRTINRITNRNRMSTGSLPGQQILSSGSVYSSGGDRMDAGYGMAQRQGTMSRAQSIKSMHSVGRGMDVFGQMDMGASMGNLSGINSLDMPSAVHNLTEEDHGLQVLGAAYIQHECYSDNDAKNEVRHLKGISELVKLFNSENQEVQRYATGATRNLIYENMDNKVALIEEGGIPQLVEALKEKDDELHKNITGILWNLSSKDNLKEKLAKETLPELTENILIPMSGKDTDGYQQTASEADIFYNTTGCLRNMSSVNKKTRQQMREQPGLVDSLVCYIKNSLEDGKAEDKGVENAMCVLRNLSYQLYGEMSPTTLMRLEGPNRAQGSGKGDAIGCYTPQGRKAKNRKNQDISTFTEVARVPKGAEWLWHPQIVGVYNRVLQDCEVNSTTREAAAGALQNITAGDNRWASVLSLVALEQERILPQVQNRMQTSNDLELRSLTGFLRNLSRHARDKNDMASKVVNNLVAKLPDDGSQKDPSSDVVVNICGVLNNLVTSSSIAARDITYFDGLPKLISIKTMTGTCSTGRMKAAKAASTVLSNMFQYKKLHKSYKEKGYGKQDFVDMMI